MRLLVVPVCFSTFGKIALSVWSMHFLYILFWVHKVVKRWTPPMVDHMLILPTHMRVRLIMPSVPRYPIASPSFPLINPCQKAPFHPLMQVQPVQPKVPLSTHRPYLAYLEVVLALYLSSHLVVEVSVIDNLHPSIPSFSSSDKAG